MATFAQRIRELRGDLTQDEVSDHLGVSESMVTKWEAGTSLPSARNLLAIAEATGASTDYILGRPGATFAGPPKWWPTEAPSEQLEDGHAAPRRSGERHAARAGRMVGRKRRPRVLRPRPNPDEGPQS